MPNKMIYVSDKDLPLLQRAQELSGGNLSAAVVRALRKFVEIEEGRLAGYKEITVKVGAGQVRRQRFSGMLLGEWGRSTSVRVEVFRVYGTRTGKFVLHVDRSPEVKGFGLGDTSWGVGVSDATLEVFDTLEALREKIPPELYEMVASVAGQPDVEDLDI